MTFDSNERAVLAALADVLIPAAEGFPAASQAGVAGGGLDAVLSFRPDLAPPPEQCRVEHAEVVEQMKSAGVDFILFESMNCISEAREACVANRGLFREGRAHGCGSARRGPRVGAGRVEPGVGLIRSAPFRRRPARTCPPSQRSRCSAKKIFTHSP